MGFFDVNIPYIEKEGSSKTSSQDASAAACKAARLRVVVKAMELGYSGVAFNRTTKGVLSDLDRCKIVPFDLSAILTVAPGLVAAAKFHREILGVSASSRFRQYTRLTVMVDSAQSAAALSSGSAVLRSYHLVAARPLNQSAFDQICKTSEVDLISIDFSQRLPFRLKLPMIKAAIERSVYFEICYSPLIYDVDARRHMLMDAKVLVDLTRGKNLIFSSGATCVTDFRGPYDVINLFSMLGLSMEKAKISLSKNCRCLLSNALHKKEYYDEAIKVQRVSTGTHINAKDWFPDWVDWDPISSGDGDLLLDDISRVSSSSESVLRNEKAPNEIISVEICPRTDESCATSAAVSDVLPEEDEITQHLSYEDLKLDNAENENPNYLHMETDDTGTENPNVNKCEGVDISVPDTLKVSEVFSDKNLNLDPDGPSFHDALNGQRVIFSFLPRNIAASEELQTRSLNSGIQNNCQSVDFSSLTRNISASEVLMNKPLNLDTEANCQSVDFSSLAGNIVASEAALNKFLNLDTETDGHIHDFPSVPEYAKISEVFPDENLNFSRDGSDAITVIPPAEMDVSSPTASNIPLQRELKVLPSRGAYSSSSPSSNNETDSGILKMEEYKKYHNVGKVNGLSFPDRIGSLKVFEKAEVSVTDSTFSVETSVKVDESRDHSALITCAQRNAKIGKAQQLYPRSLLFSSKHCIRHLLLKRKCRQFNGSRKKANNI